MNRVWIVSEWSDYNRLTVVGVYDSQEKAEQFVEEQRNSTEFDIDCRDVE